MRYRIITAGMLALAAFGASAQTVDKRPSLEPAHSPFTYEVLGATPSLQLGKRKASDNEARLAAARESKKTPLARRVLVTSLRQSKAPYVRNAIRSSEKLTDDLSHPQ